MAGQSHLTQKNQPILSQAVVDGNAFRVSKRQSIDDGQEFIVHFDPGGGEVLYIATPAVDPPENALIDVYENADPGTSTNDDMFVHNMRYDVPAEEETPEASITRVSTGGLDLTGADQTEQTQVRGNGEYQTPGDLSQRGIWRIISGDETVTVVITDDSGGTANRYAFDTVVYEGPDFK